MSTIEQKYDALLKEHISLEVKYDLMAKRLDRCEERCKACEDNVRTLTEMVQNQQKEILLLRQQVNDLMGLGNKKK